MEGFLDALTDYEELNADARRSKAIDKRDKAIAKAQQEYDAEMDSLDEELAEVVYRMRQSTTAEEVREATDLSYAHQKALLARFQGSKNENTDHATGDSDASSEGADGVDHDDTEPGF